jgi:catechol 2,3-dioxygenase-like lactoylglutathione lyase family enzyme
MMRIKEPRRSLEFYCGRLGMRLVSERHFADAKFSLYFLATLPADIELPDPTSPEASEYVKQMFNPVLEYVVPPASSNP